MSCEDRHLVNRHSQNTGGHTLERGGGGGGLERINVSVGREGVGGG